MKLFLSFLIVWLTWVGSVSAQTEGKLRTWRSKDGQYSIEARLVKFDEDQVVLRKEDGTLIEVAISAVSTNDRLFLRSQSSRVKESLPSPDDTAPTKTSPEPPPAVESQPEAPSSDLGSKLKVEDFLDSVKTRLMAKSYRQEQTKLGKTTSVSEDGTQRVVVDLPYGSGVGIAFSWKVPGGDGDRTEQIDHVVDQWIALCEPIDPQLIHNAIAQARSRMPAEYNLIGQRGGFSDPTSLDVFGSVQVQQLKATLTDARPNREGDRVSVAPYDKLEVMILLGGWQRD